MKRIIILNLFVLILNGLDSIAQEEKTNIFLSGYIKNLHELSFVDNLEQLQWTALLQNRLNFKYVPSDELTVRLEFRNRIYYGDNVKNIPGFASIISTDNGSVSLSWNILDDGNLLVNTAIDRALLHYSKEKWDITVGRQRVNWGMNVVWNPNDIFNTFNFLDFDYEERPGSDAARIQYYTGDFSKFELAVKKGRGSENYIAAAMYKFNKGSYDIQLISGIYQKDWVIGAGWEGNLKNAGFKGELSYFVPYELYLNSKNVMSASISVDYGFKKGLYLNTSFLYNSNAGDTSNDPGNLLYANLNAKNLMPYKYSGFIQLSKEFTPILSSSLNLIYSPTNHSLILIPGVTYSLATNWEMYFTSQSFFEIEDYKALGNSLFIRIRWSF